MSVKLLLNSFESAVNKVIVKLVTVMMMLSKHRRNQSFLLTFESHAVVGEVLEKYGFAQAHHITMLFVSFCTSHLVTSLSHSSDLGLILLLISSSHLSLLFEELLVRIRDLVEESITVDRKRIDDALNYWLDLHKSKDTTSNLTVQRIGTDSQELNDADFSCLFLVEVVN